MTDAKDPRLQAAIANWQWRFTSNGVPPYEFHKVTSAVETWDQWCNAWCERARIHEQLGRDALAQGHGLSAGEHLERAGVMYHFGKFLFVLDLGQMKAAHQKAITCRNLALPHLTPPGERVEIPYDSGQLIGILRKPPGIDNPAVVIMCVGLDSAKEEMGTNEMHYLRRGMATLVFDGPGQGEGEYDFSLRGDYEKPVGAVIDYVESRNDVNKARIGIWGVSMGGYFAARAAAFDKRFKACVSISGPFDDGPKLKHMPAISQDTFRVRAHKDTDAEAQAVADTLTLKDIGQTIDCPLFVLTGENDKITPPDNTRQINSIATGENHFLLIDDAGHVANNRRYMYDAATSDWMAEILVGNG